MNLAAARAALRAELTIPMTTRAVPSEVVDGYTDSGELGGLSLAVPFANYLSGRPGAGHPFTRAMKVVQRDCRRGHLGHQERKEWTGSLCHRLIMETVYWRRSTEVAALLTGIDLEHAERLIAAALRTIEQHMASVRAVPSEKADPEEYSPTRLSRAICDAVNREVRDFDQEQRIWEGQRHRDPSLSSWEDEWARRSVKHREHRLTCERCHEERAA